MDDNKAKLIKDFFARGVADVIPSKGDLKKVLESDKKLKIYIGADPTAPKLHLGHSTNILLLRILQKLGHKIIILIGDFTGMIGDPTDKSAIRVPLTSEQVQENARTYQDQLSKIIDFGGDNPAEIKFNSEWLSNLSSVEIIKLMANVTVQQMIERDMFQKRLAENKPIGLHEFIYPLLQGYDSVVMDVDAEMGGTDQTFNMMMGRHLMKTKSGKEKFVITTELLVNPKTGVKLMSKSEGGYIGLNDEPEDMYGKVMALSDEVIEPCYRMCTALDLGGIDFGSHPMELKKNLAWEIVRIYHSEEEANQARDHFQRTVVEKTASEVAPMVVVEGGVLGTIQDLNGKPGLANILVENGLVGSRSEFKRLVEEGGLYLDNVRISKDQEKLDLHDGQNLIRVGKWKQLILVRQ